MWRKLVIRPMVFRKKRTALLVLGVAMAVSLILTAQVVNSGFGTVIEQASERYGANVLILPKNFSLTSQGITQTYLDEGILGSLADPSLPILLVTRRIGDNEIVVAGTMFSRISEVNPAWRLAYENAENSSAIIGKEFGERYNLVRGDFVEIIIDSTIIRFEVAGTLNTGGSEDGYLFVDLETLQTLAGKENKLSMVMVKTDNQLSYTAMDLGSFNAEATSLEQVLKTKNFVLEKIGAIMVIMSTFIFIAAIVGVFSISRNDAVERVKEIGMMKAMGMGVKRISSFLLAEHFIVGALSTSLGLMIGLGESYFISSLTTSFPVRIGFVEILLAFTISILALTVGVGIYVIGAYRTDPAEELQGE